MTASCNSRPVLWRDLDIERFATFVTDSGWFVRERQAHLFSYAHALTRRPIR